MFTPATNTGRWYGGSGHGSASGLTTRMKKYAVKKAPKSIASDAMKRNMPSTRRARPASSGSRSAGRGAGRRRARSTLTSPPARRRHARPVRRPRSRAGRSDHGAATRSALLREGGDEDRVDALVADGVHRRRERIRVRDLTVRLDALRAQLREHLAQPAVGLRVRALVGVALRRDDQEARPLAARAPSRGSGRAAARRAPSRSRPRGCSAHPCATRRPRPRARPDDRRPPCGSPRAGRAAASPDFASGCVETISSSGSSIAIASFTAVSGSLSTTCPKRGIPASRSCWSVLSSRRPAAARRVFS